MGGSVIDLECRAVLRARLAVIIDAGRGDVGVTEPFLNLGDVGLVVEGIGGSGGAQRMRSDLEAELRRVCADECADSVGVQRLV